jgi:DNA-binding protein HU-alpha
LKKKDFVSEVVARTGLKRGDARKAVEASFALLGESLLESRSLSLPPFAKIKPMRQKEGGEASILTVKMRIKGSSDEPAETPLADPEDTR